MNKPKKLVKSGSRKQPSMSIAQISPSFGGSILGGGSKQRQLLISWSTSKNYGPCSCRYVSGKVKPSLVKGLS